MNKRTEHLQTKSGRDFFEVASLLQKSLRRGDIVYASRALDELLPRYANYAWNRLLIVSAEDCGEMVTAEVVGLYDAWLKVSKDTRPNPKKPAMSSRRIFMLKAIVLLAKCRHSRDADELGLLVSDRLPDAEFDAALRACEALPVNESDWQIPEYVYDVHTRRGRERGKTRKQFVREEHDALGDAPSLFENFDEMAASDEYVQPKLSWGES
jgi:hypothetical protein